MALALQDLKVELFTDGAKKSEIVEMARNPWIRGSSCN